MIEGAADMMFSKVGSEFEGAAGAIFFKRRVNLMRFGLFCSA
tara:strand:- start:159 stop:284 length:126 start_codon:yes stop_codon:yes gene_type:complete